MAQQLIQTQTQRLTPQQVQVVRLLELPVDELEQRINEELEANFTLEEGSAPADAADDASDTDGEAYSADPDDDGGDSVAADDREPEAATDFLMSDDDDDYPAAPTGRDPDDTAFPFANCAGDTSFREDLTQQLMLRDLTDEQRYLARYIIDSLDDSGYLTRPITALVDDLAITQNHDTTAAALAEALDIVQDLDPAGIGARDLRECLLLQLAEKTATPAARLAYTVIDKAFDDFSNKRYERLMQRFSITAAELDAVRRLVLTLHPKPAGIAAELDNGRTRAAQATPDFIVEADDGVLTLTLNDGHVPSVRISKEYSQMLDDLKGRTRTAPGNREGITMIRRKMTDAALFIEALRQRRETLLSVMHTIVQMQRDFFLTGDVTQLKPMVLRDVADRCGHDVSTISRVSNSKFVQTDFGIFAVKRLFSEAARTETGDTVSNEAVQQVLRHCIENEDKRNPLTDERLADELKAAGYVIARRTVAKYREQLGYNTARLRREI